MDLVPLIAISMSSVVAKSPTNHVADRQYQYSDKHGGHECLPKMRLAFALIFAALELDSLPRLTIYVARAFALAA